MVSGSMTNTSITWVPPKWLVFVCFLGMASVGIGGKIGVSHDVS